MTGLRRRLVITCEHGGNDVPPEYADWFASRSAQRSLQSHQGYDIGALQAANDFSQATSTPLISSTVTRLLVDLNRSLDNPSLFSRFVDKATSAPRERILEKFYHPYRDRVTSAIEPSIDEGFETVHLSVHSFTPRLAGNWRPIDIGLLFDPASPGESRLCQSWQEQLQKIAPRLRVLMNQPYAGIEDGLTTSLRLRFPRDLYAGIEIEINHRFFKQSPDRQAKVVQPLIAAFKMAASMT